MISRGACSLVPGVLTATLYPYTSPAYSSTPNDLFPDMTISGTDIVIPLAALADHHVTAANAHPVTGDPRQLLYGLIARGEEWYKDLAIKPEAINVTPRFQASQLETGGEIFLRVELKYYAYRDRPDGPLADEPS